MLIGYQSSTSNDNQESTPGGNDHEGANLLRVHTHGGWRELMKWSIIIPCGDDAEGLAKTLDSITGLWPAGFAGEVLVVNDGAHAAVGDVANRYGHPVRQTLLTENRGSYAARNAGIAATTGPHIAFVDAGCWLREDWFAGAETAIADADYVAGDVITERGLCTTLGRKYSCLIEFNVRRFFEEDRFGPTANVLVRRTLIDEVGPFDAALRSGGDREFGTRIEQFPHLRKVFAPGVAVFHEPRTLAQMIRKERRVIQGFKSLKQRHPDTYRHRSAGAAGTIGFVARRVWQILRPPPLGGYAHPLTSFGAWTALRLYALIWFMKINNAVLARAVRVDD